MSGGAEEQRSRGDRKSSWRARLFSSAPFLLVSSALLLGLGAGAGWYAWRRLTAPEPPEVPLASDDPVLAEAVEAARTEVKKQPYSAATWGQLGKLLRGCGYKEQAEICFTHAERLAPDEPRWPYLRGELLLPGRPDAALPHLLRAAELAGRGEPDNVAPWLRLAEVLLEKGEIEEAELNFRRALDIDSRDPSVHLGLGLVADARKQFAESRRHLLRARHSPFTQQRPCALRAVVCRRLGDEVSAGTFSEQAAALPPDRRWIDPYVAECLQLAVGKSNVFLRVEQLEAQGKRRDAIDLLSQIVERAPDVRAYVGLGRNLMQLGDFQGAERALESALQLVPNSVTAHYSLAKLASERALQYRRQGGDPDAVRKQFRSAADHARRAIAGKPDHGPAHVLLGLAQKELGQKKEAQETLQRAIQCSPDLAEAHLYLGQMLAEAGQKDEARRRLEQAVRLSRPEDRRAQTALDQLNNSKDE